MITVDHTEVNILDRHQNLIATWQNEVCGQFSVRQCVEHGEGIHISCMAHSLQMVVSNALNECQGVNPAITIGRNITAFVHCSNMATVKLHEIQEETGPPVSV